MTYKVALLGCGRIAPRHAHVLSEIEGLDLCAVCDVIPEKALNLASAYSVKNYTDMERMMKELKPNIVAVCTPSGMHAQHVCTLAQFGADIVVEKPLALTLDDVDGAVQCCAVAGVRLCTVKQNRYNVAVQAAKRAVDDGHIGKINFCSVRVWWDRYPDYYKDWHGTWKDAGGVLANQSDHHVDLMQWFCGPVESVYARAIYSDYAEVETGLVATVQFESGALGTLECTTLARPVSIEGSISILGDKGTIVVGGFACNEIRTWVIDGMTDSSIVGTGENPPDVYGYGHRKFYEDILAHLDAGRNWPVHWFEGRSSLEIILAMYESMETGNPVELNDRYRHSRLGKC